LQKRSLQGAWRLGRPSFSNPTAFSQQKSDACKALAHKHSQCGWKTLSKVTLLKEGVRLRRHKNECPDNCFEEPVGECSCGCRAHLHQDTGTAHKAAATTDSCRSHDPHAQDAQASQEGPPDCQP